MSERSSYADALGILRHAVNVAAKLDEETAGELCDKIEAVACAYEEAKTLEEWLRATMLDDELDEWASIVCTRDGYVGVRLSMPNPHFDALRFPSIDGEEPRPRQPGQVRSLLAKRYDRALDRLFEEGGSAEAEADFDAAQEALTSTQPVSLFHAPIQAARAAAWERLELHREDRKRELKALLDEGEVER